jgi:hypothetical protein
VCGVNVTIQQPPTHTTFDGLTATYCVVRDALTGRRTALLEVVAVGEGVTEYRTMDRRTMPSDFTFDEAIKLAMGDEQRRRGTPPPIKRKPFTPLKEHHILRNIRPMQLPPGRRYQPHPNTRPMRRLMCQKLRQRANRRAVAE